MIYRGKYTGMFESVSFEHEICKGCKHYGFCDYQLWATPDCSKIENIKEYIMKTLEE